MTESICYLCHFKAVEGQVSILPLENCRNCELHRQGIQFQGFTFNRLDFIGARQCLKD